MREDSSVHNGWHATSQTKLVDCHLSSSILCSQLPSLQTAQTWDSLLFYTQNACQLPGAASQRTAHNSHCLLNLSLFQKNPMNTIMLSNFLDISKLSHSEYFYIFIRLICQKIKKLSEENLYFIIFLTWLRAREKPTKKKKRL